MTQLDPESFLVTRRGLTKAKELTASDSVLGVQNGRPAWKDGIQPGPARAGMVHMFTDKTEIACDERTVVFEATGKRSCAQLLASFEAYDTHRLSVERATGLPVADIGAESPEPVVNGLSLSLEDYRILGLMVRRVPIYKEQVIISARNKVGQNVVDVLGDLEGKSSFGRSAIRLKSSGETARFGWDWVILENQKLLGFLRSNWLVPEEVPTWARLTRFSNMEAFVKEAARVMIHEGDEAVTRLRSFENERDIRRMIYAYGIGKGDRYEARPVPLYCPSSVEISFSRYLEDLGNTVIRAVSPRREANGLELERPEPNWFPMVDLLPVA